HSVHFVIPVRRIPVMTQRHPASRSLFVLALAATGLAGCANSPFTMPPGTQALRAPASPLAAQNRELSTRAGGLDLQNQHLHATLAQQQQQTLQTQAALRKAQQE